MVLLLLLVLGFAPHLGGHSQEWCALGGSTSNLERCRMLSSGPLVKGQDVTATAPRLGVDFSGIRSEAAP